MNKLTITNFPAASYAVQEALNTLCTNLSFSGSKVKKIVVTSSHAAEGKSFLTMSIMRTMAKFGKRVALVDADLRRSYLSARFGLQWDDPEQDAGLAHYLAGMTDMDSIICSTNIENAWMVPVGRAVSNPMPLLNTELFRQLLDYLAENVDYVFVDTPPVGVVIDAAEITKSCDGILIAVDFDTVSGHELSEVTKQLEQTGCPLLGVVLNRVEMDNYMSKKYYYRSRYSHYSDYYGEEQHGKKGKKPARRK